MKYKIKFNQWLYASYCKFKALHFLFKLIFTLRKKTIHERLTLILEINNAITEWTSTSIFVVVASRKISDAGIPNHGQWIATWKDGTHIRSTHPKKHLPNQMVEIVDKAWKEIEEKLNKLKDAGI